jgi:hypothetical protein
MAVHKFKTPKGCVVLTGDADMVWHYVAYSMVAVDGLKALTDDYELKTPFDILTDNLNVKIDESRVNARDVDRMMHDYVAHLKSQYRGIQFVPDIDQFLQTNTGTTLDFGVYTAEYHLRER